MILLKWQMQVLMWILPMSDAIRLDIGITIQSINL